MSDKNGSKSKDVFAEVAEESAGESQRSVREAMKDFRPMRMEEASIDDKLSCGFSIREIHQMKKAGMEKPDVITWADWQGPLKMNHRHMLVAHLSALGYQVKDVAKVTHFSESRIKTMLQSNHFQNQIKLIREVELQGVGARQKMKQLSSQAARVYEDILYDPKQKMSIRQKTAQDVLDRDMGKPLQKIENTGSIIKDFYHLLKAQQQIVIRETIDVTQSLDSTETEGEIVEQQPEKKKEEKPVIDADAWFARNKI
jgi:hypothetical protein